ncbi:aspartyl/asparaginyl beta-hydroxylase domain-containing protein [Phenylobacterium sp.]|uniref:aspartyl/asparaginyl beta-hydroxylase domain-containing protein n=1 Tax=Phenylobacterium sp. TaxID=1871053 RepID=UPI00286C537B|nr:aspartyl/asparaginyl beta-hydroxylase domain-containing protein [Phenylobacterium sp.]
MTDADIEREAEMTPLQAIASGDPSRALKILERALDVDPDNLVAWLSYAGLLRTTGQVDAALQAIAQGLRIEPRSFHALLMKGSIFDAQGRFAEAGRTYALALLFAPRDAELDRPTLAAVSRARAQYASYIDAFSADVRASMLARFGTAPEGRRRRFDHFVDIVSGKSRVYGQQPSDFHFPGLRAIEFYDNDEFPWLAGVESCFADILEELQVYLSGGADDFAPYVQLPVGAPVDQWADLNHSPAWSSLFLKKNGRVVEETARWFPKTLKALSLIPQPVAPNRSPVAMFSALRPHTAIPPHHGVTNTRVVLHLPLIVPDNCGFRVGSETRRWTPGKAWVFDDTIEHEAWNNSDDLRVILIADVWSPQLSQDERAMYGALLQAIDEFHGDSEAYSESL